MNPAHLHAGAGRFASRRQYTSGLPRAVQFPLVVLLGTLASWTPAAPAQSKVAPTLDSQPWYSVHVEVVQCCDDDGGRKCLVSAQEVRQMIDVANRIYAKSRVRFIWTPRNSTLLRNTLINSVVAGGLNFDAAILESKKVGARFPGKMVALFRWGDGPTKMTGGGFSSEDASCVFLASFRATNSGPRGFAHEAGHYFGLRHTFARQFANVAEASAFLRDHGGDMSLFDGDGLNDTLPDPGVPEGFNSGVTKVTLDGKVVPLPTGNIMSYMNWNNHEWMSAQQGERVRALYRFRSSHGMGCPGNIDAQPRIEAESQPFETRGGFSAGVQPMRPYGAACWSGDKQITAGGGTGGSLVVKFESKEAGPKELKTYMTVAPDYGKVRFSVDGKPVGDVFDGFAPLVAPSGPISLGSLALSPGTHTIEFTLVGKNDESQGTMLGVDCLSLTAGKR